MRANGFKNPKRFQHPRLLQPHKTARLEFASDHQTLDVEKWKKVLYSDEKIINLDGPDGFQHYWLDEDIPPETFSTRHSGQAQSRYGVYSCTGELWSC